MSATTGRSRMRDRAQLRARVAELEVALAEREEMLEAIRAALGHGAHEHLWPPGLTMAEAVTRLCAGHTHLRLATLGAEPAPRGPIPVACGRMATWP